MGYEVTARIIRSQICQKFEKSVEKDALKFKILNEMVNF